MKRFCGTVANRANTFDAAILAAQRALWQAARIAAEPAASVGIAALLTGAYKPAPGERVAVVISGANMAPGQLER